MKTEVLRGQIDQIVLGKMKKHQLLSNYVVKSDSSDEATKKGWYANDWFDKKSLVLPLTSFSRMNATNLNLRIMLNI